MKQFHQILAMTLVAGVSACHQDDDSLGHLSPEVRDSAGVRIVESPDPPVGSRLAWQVASAPAVTIGRTDGDPPYLLDDVRDAARLPDGRIVVADGGSNELRVFDAFGVHTATWRRRGEGPGEFTSLAGVGPWPGDSLVAWNARGGAIPVFDLEGNLGRSIPITSSEPVAVAATLRGGTIVTFSESMAEASRTAGGRLLAQAVHYRSSDAAGRPTGSLGVHPGRRIYSSQIAGQAFMMPVPFSPSVSAAAWGEFAVVAPNHRYEIRAYSADGVLQRIIRRDRALIASTAAHFDAHFLDLLRQREIRPATEAERDEALRESRRAFGDIPLPETLPAFATLIADAQDFLWVRDFEVPAEVPSSPAWTIVDPEGVILGHVETPLGLEIHEIGVDYILGRATDDLGVEYVQLWPLTR